MAVAIIAAATTTAVVRHRSLRPVVNCAPLPTGIFPAAVWLNGDVVQPSWSLGIVGDGFTCEALGLLQGKAVSFVKGFKSVEPFMRHRNAIQAALVSPPSKSATVSTLEEKRETPLGVTWNSKQSRCYVEPDERSERLIAKAVIGIPRLHTIWVVANTPTEEGGGCARGSLVYLARGAILWTIAHEMGHAVGGLLDEYGAEASAAGAYTGPPVYGPNCSTLTPVSSEPWHRLQTEGTLKEPPLKGCLGHPTGVFRPSSSCRMDSDSVFCAVCDEVLETQLRAYESPVNSTGIYSQLIVRVTRGAKCAKGPSDICADVLEARTFKGIMPAQYRTITPFIYGVRAGDRTVAAGVLMERPFTARSWTTSAAIAKDRSKAVPEDQPLESDVALYVLHVPDVSLNALPSVKLTFVELIRPLDTPVIDPAVFDKLRDQDFRRSWISPPAAVPQ